MRRDAIELQTNSISIDPDNDRIELDGELRTGWHRLRIALTTPDRIGVRKRIEVATNHDQLLASLQWNESLAESYLVHLDEPVSKLKLQFRHVRGSLRLQLFSLKRVSAARAALGAVGPKLRLLRQFNCLGPVLGRGTRHLLRGEFGAFGRKLLKGLPDSRTMRLETKRIEESGAVWWRRRTLSAEEIIACRRECDSLDDPQPVAVILPADPTRVDHARQAAFSVLRQIYPHWQLRILWAGKTAPAKLVNAVRHDDRAKIVCHDDLAAALRAALAEVPCDRAVVLSPDAELSLHALLRMSQHSKPTNYLNNAVAVPVSMLVELDQKFATAVGLLQSVQQRAELEGTEPLASAIDGGGQTLLHFPPRRYSASLLLAGNFTGLTGWDAVAYQVLRGLSGLGIQMKRHFDSPHYSHTLPPGLSFEKTIRRPVEPLLIVAPPFQLKSFVPDSRSAIFSMWECDRLPPASVPFFNASKVVIVPSNWGMESFRVSGVTVPIEIVPLGYDPLTYFPKPKTVNEICVFGTAGALGAGGIRKNIGLVAKAFLAAFPDEADVRLRIKITPNCPPVDWPADPRIEIMRAVLPASDVADWNRSLDAYVNGSMAEGFGLHLLEAMACGVPLISTRVSAPADYFDGRVGIVIPHRETRVANECYQGCWYEPEFDALVAAMRSVREDRAAANSLGRSAAARARRFTWRDTGRQLLAVLRKYVLIPAETA